MATMDTSLSNKKGTLIHVIDQIARVHVCCYHLSIPKYSKNAMFNNSDTRTCTCTGAHRLSSIIITLYVMHLAKHGIHML